MNERQLAKRLSIRKGVPGRRNILSKFSSIRREKKEASVVGVQGVRRLD